MQFPESWLRTFVDPDLDTDALAHALTMAGLEVEETVPAAPPFSNVVVAQIISVDPHPDADRLKVCMVTDGATEPLQIVCGAPNAQAGIKVPLARIGAELPDGMKIRKTKMRGVESFGMLCSGQELGISQDHDGLLILDDALEAGQSLRDVLDLDDICFTLKLTPNRGDCLSIHGIAREVGALTGAAVTMPSFDPVPVTLDEILAVDVQAPDLCGRFAGRVIRGVNASARTPDWMASRLMRAGQRPVSVLVDISNYVMLELGRPTHVFDLDRIAGPLDVRWAKKGESVELLNEQTVELDAHVGVISSNGRVESLAGIMGGQSTAVSLETTNIYLEGAFWWPEAIMGRARQFKFNSEASHRFERGVDAASILPHLEYTTRLILEICGGQAGPLDDQQLNMPVREAVTVRVPRCHKVLGVPVSTDDITDIFTRLDFQFSLDADTFTVTPPSHRFDLEIEEDFIEEIARVYGFERIPTRPPVALANINIEPESLRGPHALRARMAALDYQEVINFAFVQDSWETNYAGNDDPIRLLNPIASQLAVMRSSLIGGLLENIEHNVHHRQTRVRVFELGRVFMRDAGVSDGDLSVAGVHQPNRIAGAAWGPASQEQWSLPVRQVDFYDVKRDVEALLGGQAADLRCVPDVHPALHPGRSARLVLGDNNVGWLGEVHPQWVQKLELGHPPVVFELDVDALSTLSMPEVQRLSRQPVVIRDLAVWVDTKVSFQSLLDTLNQTIAAHKNLSLVKDILLFDVWRDKTAQSEQKSMALRFWLQSPDSTLDDATVEECMGLLLQALANAHDARLRT